MAPETRTAEHRHGLLVEPRERHRLVRMAAGTSHGLRYLLRRVAVGAGRRAMRPEADREAEVVAWRRRRLRSERAGCNSGRRRSDERGDPCDGPMTDAAVTGEGLRDAGALMPWLQVRPVVFLVVTPEALDRRPRPLVVRGAQVAFVAVCKRMHAGQREAREAMDLERPRDLPPRCGVAPVARLREASPVKIGVTRRALTARRRALREMARDARDVRVEAREREARLRMIEAALLRRATGLRLPSVRRMAGGAGERGRDVGGRAGRSARWRRGRRGRRGNRRAGRGRGGGGRSGGCGDAGRGRGWRGGRGHPARCTDQGDHERCEEREDHRRVLAER